MQGTYYKEWSRFLGREMEFKVYGTSGVPVLAFPCRAGRFYDWENHGMPDSVAQLLNAGKMQLFCADSIDGESLSAIGVSARRRAEMQEKYFNYIVQELAPRIHTLNAAAKAEPVVTESETAETAAVEAPAAPAGIWCIGTDLGAYHAVNFRLRRPQVFAGAVALSGSYDTPFSPTDDLELRNSPFVYLTQEGFFSAEDKAALNTTPASFVLCAGQGAYENAALDSTRSLDAALSKAGIPVHTEIWGNDVSHDWYWWCKQLSLFCDRLFG